MLTQLNYRGRRTREESKIRKTQQRVFINSVFAGAVQTGHPDGSNMGKEINRSIPYLRGAKAGARTCGKAESKKSYEMAPPPMRR